MTTLEVTVRCPACSADVVTDRFVKAGHRYVRCTGCGLSRLDPLPSERDALDLYDASYFVGGANGGYANYAADEALHRVNARRRLALLDRAGARPPGRLLDVGCAHGFFLDEARRHGWDVVGVEISPGPAAFARRELSLDVHSSVVDVEGPFDVVSAFQVLAHLVDPTAFVTRAAALLRPGGSLAIETPNASSRVARTLGRFWHLATPPSIVWMFDQETLTELLRSAGFEPVLTARTPKTVSLGFVGAVVRQKYPRLGRPIGLLGASPRIAARAVRVDLGDELTLVAQRSD